MSTLFSFKLLCQVTVIGSCSVTLTSSSIVFQLARFNFAPPKAPKLSRTLFVAFTT